MPDLNNGKTMEEMSGKNRDKFISVIYNQKNDSPKYFEIKKSKILLFVIGLPTITLISLFLGFIGLIHTSPFHLINAYKQNSMARDAISKTNALVEQIKTSEADKLAMTKKLNDVVAQLKSAPNALVTNTPSNNKTLPQAPTLSTNFQGLSALSLFRPVQGQKDHTKPASLNLSSFKVLNARDTISLQFNIIPASEVDGKLAGNIIVLMKNELTIQVYPAQALNSSDTQINYLSGEPFATQHFRPVDANFLKPRKPGNYTFAIYIFAKNGDLIHYQSIVLPVKFY